VKSLAIENVMLLMQMWKEASKNAFRIKLMFEAVKNVVCSVYHQKLLMCLL
jgi:hypothetical protein